MMSSTSYIEPQGQRASPESPLYIKLSHLVVRLIVILNIAHLSLSFYQPYFTVIKQLFRGGADFYWMMASSFLLPVYVGVEAWWMLRRDRSNTKALLIDGAFVIGWFVIFWAFLLHSFWRYVGSL